MTIDRRPRRAALFGAAFGAWIWGWTELLGRAAVAWRDPALAERVPALASPEAFVRSVAESLGLPAPVGWAWAVGLVLAGGLLGAGASLLVRALRLDRDDLAGESMRWSQGWTAPIAWLVLVGLVVAGAVVLPIPDGVAVALLVLTVPLLLVALSAVTSPRYAAGVENRWWRPVWPGGKVLVAWVLVQAVAALLLFGLALASEDASWLRVGLVLLGFWIALYAGALGFHALVERIPPSRLATRAAKLLRPSALGPWLVLGARQILLLAFCSIPLFAVLAWQAKVAPVLQQWEHASGREIALELRWATNGLGFLERYAVLFLEPAVVLLSWGQAARLVYRVASSSFGSPPPSRGGSVRPEP